ncbi:zinc finger protein RFP-like [Python bivittatus]|uniref:RING-type E3 ubiquitin transferase n=1 Tax=Python bivittatus TaxID=176946 RepID=A0A9F5JBZ8_PYTBI|nr:zinc finger protein RFP-like [Python bivittatus]
MATGVSVLVLHEEATCPICLDYFQDPVLIPECGHNFCRSCLTRSWGQLDSGASCPHCRQSFWPRNILANRQLSRVLEVTKQCGPWGEEGGSFCRMHWEPLKLFCKNHETLICWVCDRSREHRDHRVIPLEEAFQEYQIKVGDCLKAQKEEKIKIVTYGRNTEEKTREMLDLIKRERENTVAEFRKLRCWLEEQEKLLLARMEETEKEIVARRDECLAKHVEELSSLDNLIQEMEKKQQQPASKLLQDIGSVLEKYQPKKPLENPVAFPLELKWTIWDYRDISVFLKGIIKQFRDTLEVGLELQKANVILDPDTAHPGLVLSEDRKSIRAVVEDQCLPKNPERFENWLYVLGCQEFSTGRHFWEVTVGKKEEWYVGVAKKLVNRKDYINLCPEEGIWEVGKWARKYRANIPPKYPKLPLTKNLKRIRVSLNCEGGQVTFFDAKTAALLYKFSEAPLAGETLLPSFSLNNDDWLTLSP